MFRPFRIIRSSKPEPPPQHSGLTRPAADAPGFLLPPVHRLDPCLRLLILSGATGRRGALRRELGGILSLTYYPCGAGAVFFELGARKSTLAWFRFSQGNFRVDSWMSNGYALKSTL